MGRRPKASNNNHMPGNAFPSKERFEPQQQQKQQVFSGNIRSPTKVLDSQLENPHPACSPLKHPNVSVAGAKKSLESKTPQEQMNQASKHQKKYATSTRKMSKHSITSVRRSDRIKSGVVKSANSKQGGVEHMVDVTVSDSEIDEPERHTEQVSLKPQLDTQVEQVQVLPQSNTQIKKVLPQLDGHAEQALPKQNAQIEQLLLVPEPEPTENISEKSLDEKVDYALQRIQAFDKIVELLKSKADGNVTSYEAPSMTVMAPISYRSMYIDSQKKLEALANENRQLTGQLENALGKIEMYENENRVLSELLEKLKDTANQQLSNLAKSTEAAVNASTLEIYHAYSASASKRKRIEGGNAA